MNRVFVGLPSVVVPPVVMFAVGVGVWHLATVVFGIPPILVPAPAAVWNAAVAIRDELLSATWLTARASLLGLGLSVVVGTGVACCFAVSSFLRRGCYPYAIFLQTVPIIAIAPLVIIWFGRGFRSVVIIAFIISLFPIITNTTTGLLNVDDNLLDLFRLHRASTWQTLRRLRFPNAIAYLLAGARISCGVAVVGAIVGEFFVGFTDEYGLGYLIRQKHERLQTAELFAAVIASTLLGVTVFLLVTGLGTLIDRLMYGVRND